MRGCKKSLYTMAVSPRDRLFQEKNGKSAEVLGSEVTWLSSFEDHGYWQSPRL